MLEELITVFSFLFDLLELLGDFMLESWKRVLEALLIALIRELAVECVELLLQNGIHLQEVNVILHLVDFREVVFVDRIQLVFNFDDFSLQINFQLAQL